MMRGQWRANDATCKKSWNSPRNLGRRYLFQHLRSVSTNSVNVAFATPRRPGNTRRRVAVAAAAKTCQQFSADFPPGSTRTHERGQPRTSTLCRKKQQFRCGFCLFASSVCPAHGTPIQTANSPLNLLPLFLGFGPYPYQQCAYLSPREEERNADLGRARKKVKRQTSAIYSE